MLLAALIQRRRPNEKQLERLKKLQKQLQADDLYRSAEAGINIALVAKAFAQKHNVRLAICACCIESFFAMMA